MKIQLKHKIKIFAFKEFTTNNVNCSEQVSNTWESRFEAGFMLSVERNVINASVRNASVLK